MLIEGALGNTWFLPKRLSCQFQEEPIVPADPRDSMFSLGHVGDNDLHRRGVTIDELLLPDEDYAAFCLHRLAPLVQFAHGPEGNMTSDNTQSEARDPVGSSGVHNNVEGDLLFIPSLSFEYTDESGENCTLTIREAPPSAQPGLPLACGVHTFPRAYVENLLRAANNFKYAAIGLIDELERTRLELIETRSQQGSSTSTRGHPGTSDAAALGFASFSGSVHGFASTGNIQPTSSSPSETPSETPGTDICSR